MVNQVMLQVVILMNVVYVLVITQVVLIVQVFPMVITGKVNVDVLQLITQVMTVMIVMV